METESIEMTECFNMLYHVLLENELEKLIN
ncbi:MAG: hypothetical protein Satyrvirus42_5, partial [Satyrvirus sp.]